MNARAQRLLAALGSRSFLVLLTWASAGYVLLERTGVFRLQDASWWEVFHSIPSQVLGLLLALNAVLLLRSIVRRADRKPMPGSVLVLISLVLLVLGQWLSIGTRFEGKVIRAEGQSFEAFPANYIPETVMRKKYAELPQIGLTLLHIDPILSTDGKALSIVKIPVLYAGRTARGVREGALDSRWPFISDWTLVRISDFGYMIRYVLSDPRERPLEWEDMFLKVFPSGAEDYFLSKFLGYVFYLQCYPDYIDQGGVAATRSAEPKNPVFRLRIVRNKDIVYNGLLRPDQKVKFDNVVLSIPAVKKWVEITLVRDLGLPVTAIALLVLLAGVTLIAMRRETFLNLP